MTSIDNLTIICSALLLVTMVLSSIQNPFLRKAFIRKSKDKKNPTSTPPLSVIITIHEEIEALEAHLSDFLNQDYPDFQIIIVTEKGSWQTEDVLKLFANDPRLYCTFIPENSRYMSRKKLAITLGVKAAEHEWVLLTEPTCRPNSDQWLKQMARNCGEDVDLIMGYSTYANEPKAKAYYRFTHIHTAFYLFRKAFRRTAFRTNCPNLMFRKSKFIAQNGFQGNLEWNTGPYDFIVNKYATKSNTVIELSQEARITEDNPTRKAWKDQQISCLETQKHLHRKLSMRLLFTADQVAMHLHYILIMAAMAYALLTQKWMLVASTAFILASTIIVRTLIGCRAIAEIGEHLPTWKIICLEIGIIWNHALNSIRHRLADKNDFTTHKL